MDGATRRPLGYSRAMEQRPYLRTLTNLSGPLRAALAFGALAALTWLVAVTLSWGFDQDVDFLSVVLFGAMAAGMALNVIDRRFVPFARVPVRRSQ